VAPSLPADADDLEAIRRVLSGQQDAFRVLVDKYGHSIYNLALRMTGSPADAEDLAQDAFVQAFTRLRDFRVGSRFHPWLYTIALNLCRNHLRRKALLRWLPLQGAAREDNQGRDVDPPEPSSSPEGRVLEQDAETRLQAAIHALPEKYREVFLLRQAHGLSYEEITEVTGLPLGTVEVRLFRARKRLLQALGLGESTR
jgi:RNA polymerase sigma-70 factor (ECF subfamily)